MQDLQLPPKGAHLQWAGAAAGFVAVAAVAAVVVVGEHGAAGQALAGAGAGGWCPLP
jgi:hypothetical protein